MVEVPVLVPVPVNLPATAPLFKANTTTIIPDNPSTSVPANHYTHLDPAPVLTTTATTVSPINGDAETPIDGQKLTEGPYLFQILDINIHLSIDLSIN